jgi:hypothetical protein
MSTLAAAGLLALLSINAPLGAHKSAVIVGVNEPFDGTMSALRYADDDAARFFEMLAPEAEHLELLTLIDAESQPLYISAAAAARSPDRKSLYAALDRAEKASTAAREAGRRTELYFIYTGHGRIEGGEGQMKLKDGALSRTELTERVLKSAAFDRIHVIIDACNAYHLVSARGADGSLVTKSLDAAFDRFVEEHALDRFPSAGFVLSTSGAGATHEWSRYQGGVFSHEIRSALAGAADANGDQRVDYTEMEAFLAAANMAVPELKGRPKVFVRPPALEHAAALYAPAKDAPAVELPAMLAGHFFLEDDRGLRYAELNKAEGYAVSLRLVPRAKYQLLRAGGGEIATIDAQDPHLRMPIAWPVEERALARTERGGEAPSGAFSEAYGPRFVDGFRAANNGVVMRSSLVEDPLVGTKLRVGGILLAAAGVTAAVFAVSERMALDREHARYSSTFNDPEKQEHGARVEDHRKRMIGFAIAGSAALALATTIAAFDLAD